MQLCRIPAAVCIVAIAACESTETKSCTWTGPDGTQQNVTATHSKSTRADVASIEALAGVARSVVAGAAGAPPPGAAPRSTAPPATLPETCARMFSN